MYKLLRIIIYTFVIVGSEQALLTSDINIIHTHQVLLAVLMPQPNLNSQKEEEEEKFQQPKIETQKITISKTKAKQNNT